MCVLLNAFSILVVYGFFLKKRKKDLRGKNASLQLKLTQIVDCCRIVELGCHLAVFDGLGKVLFHFAYNSLQQ